MSFVIVVCAVIVLVTVSVSVEYELRTPQNYRVELLFLSLGITQSFLEVSIFSTFTSNILQLFRVVQDCHGLSLTSKMSWDNPGQPGTTQDIPAVEAGQGP